MKPRVYVETSVISYLTAWPSRDLVTAARQQITREWWEVQRSRFALFISEFVFTEACSGDDRAAGLRVAALQGIPLVELTPIAMQLGEHFLEKGALPRKATIDALHIAVAVTSGMDFLLTWNFKHLANAALRSSLDVICLRQGFEPCVICTPEELGGE